MSIICTIIGIILCIWCAGQLIGWLPSYHNMLSITGPFDNPAGISATLSLLLPFAMYETDKSNKWRQIIGIVISLAIVAFVIVSEARAAILAVAVILTAYAIHWVKTRTKIKFSTVHYYLMVAMGIVLFVGLYSIKKDSANGRILIWKCSGQLIAKKPILGFGKNGFTANYMNEQALYFSKYPDSKYVMLADNVRHPFNEYIESIVEYGFIGFLLTGLVLFYPLYYSRKSNSNKLFSIRLSLLSIATCSLFSYPLNYPFIRLITITIIAYLLVYNEDRRIFIVNNYFVKGIVIIISLGLLSATTFQILNEREWNRIAHKSLRGETHKMLPRYKSLFRYLQCNDLFLYNYAAELNVAGHYEESLQIARKCEKLWTDYDLQMLMADNCLHLKQYYETESYLKKAAAMCPVKFMPLYRLTELYLETERKEEARILAQKILDKKEKIPSSTTKSIKNIMKNYLNGSSQVFN